jgi:hypothetical protein
MPAGVCGGKGSSELTPPGGRVRSEPILDSLWPANLPTRVSVCAMIDAARDRRIYDRVYQCSLEKSCLFAGTLPPEVEVAAPYLVRLERDDLFTRYLIEHGWGRSWGTFLRADRSFEQIRRHLRQILRVRDDSGRILLFRYYDPRVLRVYLPTCNREELATVFGDLDAFLMEDVSPDTLLQFSMKDSRLAKESRLC